MQSARVLAASSPTFARRKYACGRPEALAGSIATMEALASRPHDQTQCQSERRLHFCQFCASMVLVIPVGNKAGRCVRPRQTGYDSRRNHETQLRSNAAGAILRQTPILPAECAEAPLLFSSSFDDAVAGEQGPPPIGNCNTGSSRKGTRYDADNKRHGATSSTPTATTSQQANLLPIAGSTAPDAAWCRSNMRGWLRTGTAHRLYGTRRFYVRSAGRSRAKSRRTYCLAHCGGMLRPHGTPKRASR